MKEFSFKICSLSFKEDVFANLLQTTAFEAVGKGRLGNHLVDCSEKGVPLVRTTSNYSSPAQQFNKWHKQVRDEVIKKANEHLKSLPSELSCNNALIEVYDAQYKKMKYHSDQSLDLISDSYIALFSCYEHPNELQPYQKRILKVKDKTTLEEFEIPLDHQTLVLFSLDTNTKYLHKIVMVNGGNIPKDGVDNRWMGITYRTSATYIQFKNGAPYFKDGTLLKLANEEEKKTFYKLRGEENRSVDFKYPSLPFTISQADCLPPE